MNGSASNGSGRAARDRRCALLLVLMAFVAYSYWVPRGPLANSDTRLALTRAIVDDHTLRIDRYAAGVTSDRSAYQGHYYTDKTPAVSFLAVPLYAGLRVTLPRVFFQPALFFIVRYLLTALAVGLPAALFVGLFWRFLSRSIGRRRAALLAAGYAFGTMAWALSALMFSHMLAASCLFGAFMLLFPVLLGERPPAHARWAAAGALCGLAVGFEYPAAIVAAGIGAFAVYLAVRARRFGIVAPFVVAALAGIAPVALYNVAAFGAPWSQGYAHLGGAAQFRGGMRHGIEGIGLPDLAALWGITFSPYRGIFVLSPFLLLAVPGLRAMWRDARVRAAAVVCAGVTAAMLLFNSGYYFWDGGVSLGPRHFAPALPFLTFPVAYAMRRARWNAIASLLIAVSIGTVTLCCITVLIFLPGVPDPIITLALAHLLHGPTPNNWGMLLGLRGAASLLPFAVLEAVLSVMLWRATGHGHAGAVPQPARPDILAA